MKINLKDRLIANVSQDVFFVVQQSARAAEKYGINIFLIGGIVRDLLLDIRVKDIDIIVEGNAVDFAYFLETEGNAEVLSVQENLKTAKVRFDKGTEVDFASSRRELYSQPGYLPTAYDFGCKLEDDVKRRDFTINTLALALTGDNKYCLVDYFFAVNDIKTGTIKILHENSFIDDPSRIIRALKFKERLGFFLDDNTSELMNKYLENPSENIPLERIKGELQQYFSLNSRNIYFDFIKSGAYKLLTDNPFTDFDYGRITEAKNFGLISETDIFFVYFALLIINSSTISDKLNLTSAEKKVIEKVGILLKTQIDPNNKKEIYYAFNKCEKLSSALYYIMTGNDAIKIYLKELKDIKVEITGKDLIVEGFKPSPLFTQIFDRIIIEKINGNLKTKREEIDFVIKNFKN